MAIFDSGFGPNGIEGEIQNRIKNKTPNNSNGAFYAGANSNSNEDGVFVDLPNAPKNIWNGISNVGNKWIQPAVNTAGILAQGLGMGGLIGYNTVTTDTPFKPNVAKPNFNVDSTAKDTTNYDKINNIINPNPNNNGLFNLNNTNNNVNVGKVNPIDYSFLNNQTNQARTNQLFNPNSRNTDPFGMTPGSSQDNQQFQNTNGLPNSDLFNKFNFKSDNFNNNLRQDMLNKTEQGYNNLIQASGEVFSNDNPLGKLFNAITKNAATRISIKITRCKI